jgi:uncharacterized membrane protein (UPF0127 family)
MDMKKIIYSINGKEKNIKVKLCDTPWKKFTGLMFKKSSTPLLFTFNKNKNLSIHSFFCKPFRAIWLDEKMCATKILNVKKWRPKFCGKGKYLLEIPVTTSK